MLNSVLDLSFSLQTNYPEVPDSYLTVKLTLSVYIPHVLINGAQILPGKLVHLFLCKPYGLAL